MAHSTNRKRYFRYPMRFNDNMLLLEFLCNVCLFVQHSLLAEMYRDVIEGVCCRIWATTSDVGVDQNVQGCASTL